MQEIDTQNQNQSHQTTSDQHRIVQPIKANSNNKLPIILSAILILLTTASTAYLYYQNQLLKQQILEISKPKDDQTSTTKNNNQQDEKLQWNTYQSIKFNYTINYPKDWKAFSVEPGVGDLALKDDSKGFITYPNTYTGANAKTSILIETDGANNLAPYSEDWWKNTQTKFFKIDKDTKTTFAGQTARVTEGDYDGYGFPARIKVIEFYSPDNKTLFSIIITDQKESPSTEKINQILSTFKLNESNWQTYTNSEYKFSLRIPPNYEVRNVFPLKDYTIARFGYAPKTLKEDVSGIIEVSNLTFFEYMAKFKLEYQQNKDLEIVVQKPTILNGLEASELVYLNKRSNIQFSQIFVPSDTYVYSLGGAPSDGSTDSQILQSFRLIN